LLEFVRNREFSKVSNKGIAENPHAPLGALLSSCAPLASRASVAHLRCALRDLTWVTLSQRDDMIELGSFAASSPRHRTGRHEAALCIAHKAGEELIHAIRVLDVGRCVPDSCAVGTCIQVSVKEDTLVATLHYTFCQYL
jgi:hypothetical protein